MPFTASSFFCLKAGVFDSGPRFFFDLFFTGTVLFFLQGVKKFDRFIVPELFNRMAGSPPLCLSIPCKIRVMKIIIRSEPSWHETWYIRIQEPKAWMMGFEYSEED